MADPILMFMLTISSPIWHLGFFVQMRQILQESSPGFMSDTLSGGDNKVSWYRDRSGSANTNDALRNDFCLVPLTVLHEMGEDATNFLPSLNFRDKENPCGHTRQIVLASLGGYLRCQTSPNS